MTAAPAALAADECGAAVAGEAVCTAAGNVYPNGIEYVAAAGSDITVTLEDGVIVTTAADDGVIATGVADFNATIIVETGVDIDAYDWGVSATASGTGDASVVIAEGSTVSAGFFGVNASAADGVAVIDNGADVTVDGDINPGLGAVGISAGANGGAVVTNTGAILVDSTTDAGAVGIIANGLGAVSVTSTADITVGNTFGGATGVGGYSATSVDIINIGEVTVVGGGEAAGIRMIGDAPASVAQTGDVNVTSLTADAVGVSVDAVGAASIDVVGNVSVIVDDVTENAYGVAVAADAAPTSTVDIVVDGVVDVSGGHYSIGVYATGGGAISVDVGDVVVGSETVPAAYGWGVYAINSGGSSISITAGDVTVHQDGSYAYGGGSGITAYTTGATDILAADIVTTGYYADGVEVGGRLDIGGDTTISVNSVTTYGWGSDGVDVGAHGDIDVTVGSVVTEGRNAQGLELTTDLGSITASADSIVTHGELSDGVFAYAEAGDVAVTVGDVATYGLNASGVVAVTGAAGAGNAGVTVTGYVYSYDGYGVEAVSQGAATVSVTATGAVYGFDAGVYAYSVDGSTIVNAGVITGGDGLAINAVGAAAIVDNTGYIYGAVDLTENADTFDNDGVFEAYGVSNFRAGSDMFINTGEVGFGRGGAAAETTTFLGLETFSNAGVVSGADGQVGDELELVGTVFSGAAGSTLEVDAELGAGGDQADVLIIGSATGVTEVVANDVLAAQPGVLDFGGILVVDSASATETGGEFFMDQDKGFIRYSLSFDAANDDWYIVGLPDAEAFELLVASAAAQEFWASSASAVSSRWQEVRDASGELGAGPGGEGRAEGWELWGQAHGGSVGFDDEETFAIGGFTFHQNLGHDSDWAGFQLGADNLSGDLIWGFTAGFVQQETEFELDGNSFDIEGWNVGAYVGWSASGFFANGLLKGDFYEVDGDFTTVPTRFTFDGTTWGVQGEVGYRFGDSWYVEPVASLAWSSTDLDSLTTSGVSVDFGDNDSLVGKAGLRFGGTWGSGDMVMTPFIGAYAVEELEGENEMTFATGATAFTIQDTPVDGYAQVELGVTLKTFMGLEGFVKGEWNVGGDADGGAARLGARWRW